MNLFSSSQVIDSHLTNKSRCKFKEKKHFLKYIQTENVADNILANFFQSSPENFKEDFWLMMLYKTMETALDKALLNDQFEMYFQPQMCLHTQKVLGVESLIRWNHPEYGFISPIKFIPLAEETELIIPMGEWILKESCLQMKKLLPLCKSFRLAVNLSPYQFRDPHLARTITRILKDVDFPPQLLTLEITESHLIDDYNQTIEIMNQLKKIGISFALDDFGTGYASFSHLNQLPFNIVKLDKSFVTYSVDDKQKNIIVSGIIKIAQNLGLEIHAEGIENISELNFLRDKLVDLGQGYLFSKPLSFDQFKNFLINNNI